jgi:hypothetical protein
MYDKTVVLSGTALHLLNPVAPLFYAFFYKWRCFLYVAELALFLCHFLSALSGGEKIFFAVIYCPLVWCTCVNNHIKVHYLAILLCDVSVIYCTFHIGTICVLWYLFGFFFSQLEIENHILSSYSEYMTPSLFFDIRILRAFIKLEHPDTVIIRMVLSPYCAFAVIAYTYLLSEVEEKRR